MEYKKNSQKARLSLEKLRKGTKGYLIVQNISSKQVNDGASFIKYWLDNVNGDGLFPYTCPATHKVCYRGDLDGAHVKLWGSKNAAIYITAVHKSFNRSRSPRPFLVKKEYLVAAPE